MLHAFSSYVWFNFNFVSSFCCEKCLYCSKMMFKSNVTTNLNKLISCVSAASICPYTSQLLSNMQLHHGHALRLEDSKDSRFFIHVIKQTHPSIFIHKLEDLKDSRILFLKTRIIIYKYDNIWLHSMIALILDPNNSKCTY